MKRRKYTVGGAVKWVIAILLVLLQVYPFFYVFTSSFKSLDDFRKLPAYALPSALDFTNYITVFTKSHMFTYFKNSIIVLVGVLIPLLLILPIFMGLRGILFSAPIADAGSAVIVALFIIPEMKKLNRKIREQKEMSKKLTCN